MPVLKKSFQPQNRSKTINDRRVALFHCIRKASWQSHQVLSSGSSATFQDAKTAFSMRKVQCTKMQLVEHVQHLPCTMYNTHQAKHLPCTASALHSICHAQHLPSTASVMHSICHAQHLPCTMYKAQSRSCGVLIVGRARDIMAGTALTGAVRMQICL